MLSRISSLFVTALLVMTAITSCTNEDIWYSTIEDAAKREYYYNAKFESMFGKIDPNQDWGFGIQGLSRAVDMDASHWTNWPDAVTQDEIMLVWLYLMSSNPQYQAENPILTSFYLTQVFASYDTYIPYDQKDEDEPETVTGSIQMNFLHVSSTEVGTVIFEANRTNSTVLETNGWEHSNNFNASDNANYNGNTVHYNSGTYDFAYGNSTQENKMYNTYEIIKGESVIQWAQSITNWSDLKENLRKEWSDIISKYHWNDEYINFKDAFETFNFSTISTDFLNKFSDYYYVCFDYECIPDNNETRFLGYSYTVTITLEDETEIVIQKNDDNITITGSYESINEVEDQVIAEIKKGIISSIETSKKQGWYDYCDYKDVVIDENNELTNVVISISGDNVTTEYTQGDKLVFGDKIYTDWVVRLVGPAVPDENFNIETGNGSITYDKRVIVEDLSVAAANDLSNVSESDWDFNDVVMDIHITPGETEGSDVAEVKIQALGGTLPIYLGYEDSNGIVTLSDELHFLMGASSYGLMINTGLSNNLSPVETELTGVFTTDGVADYNKVRVYVDKDIKQTGNPSDYTELKAEKGKAPCKICVGTDFYWCKERVLITRPYSNFSDWVSGRSETDSNDNVSVKENETTTYKWYYSDIEKATDANDENFFNSLVFGNGN